MPPFSYRYHELKIKHLSLSAELAIIHRQETKIKKAANPRRFAKFGPHQKGMAADQLAKYKADKAARLAKLRATQWTDRRLHDLKSIRDHRIDEIRPEVRASHLARGFLKGMPYRRMENYSSCEPPLTTVVRIVESFSSLFDKLSGDETLYALRDWIDGIPYAEGWIRNSGAQPEHNGKIDVILKQLKNTKYTVLNQVAGDLVWDMTATATQDVVFAWRPHQSIPTPAA